MRRIPHFVLASRVFLAPLCATALVAVQACQPSPEPIETLEDVAEETEQATGEIVTVEGRINRVLGKCAFELTDAEFLFPDRVLTLCDPAGSKSDPPIEDLAVEEGDWLRVTGVAGEITRQAYEYKTTLTVADDVFDEMQPRAVLFLHSAEKIEEPEPTPEEAAELPEGPVVVPIL